MSSRNRTSQPPDGFGNQNWDGLVVIVAGVSWDDTWLSEKHLAIHLSRLVPVLYVDPAISLLTPLKKPALRSSTDGPRLRMIGTNLARLTPLTVPGISRPGLRVIASWATRRAIARSVDRLGGQVLALVAASLDDVFGSCSGLQVMYGTDDWITGGSLMGLSSRWLRKRETAQLRRADVVVAVSDQLAARWAPEARAVVVIPNGCDTDHFAAVESAVPANEVTLPDPIAGFIGHLSDRIDLDALEKIAGTGASLLLIGPRQATFNLEKMEALLAHPNVQWVGPQPFSRLPSFMARIAVGLTPYTDSDFNRSSDPLKTLEYLSAGKPAVVSDLPSVSRIPKDLVDVSATPEEFAERTLEVLGRTPDPVLAQRRRLYAASQNWDARARDFVALFSKERQVSTGDLGRRHPDG
ncbi:glycosyltransferase [Cryobacterium algoritolerans]|uniref:Glycosyltransferase n=1 Tax=Cryobacterium algoritolerans TaxID=1259184 RepID=A0A4R8X1M2_9MICO|nr:glycosyltransferase [Cryobacterium algoritolerans]TFC19830.1 glycosyltransferase [Cryobacterium algoritolerans]